jgi:two-component system, NtrC family, sensor kinase
MLYLPSMILEPIPDSLWNGYGWFRYRFAVDSSVYSKVTNLYFSTYGAAEVYLDGKLVQKYGVFSTNPQEEKYYNRYYNFYMIHPAVVLQPAGSHVLAVRFSYHKGTQYKKLLGKYALTFGFNTGIGTDNVNQLKISTVKKDWQFIYISGTMLLLIVLLHGFLYLLFPTDRSHLYIAIVAFLLFLHIVVSFLPLFFELDILQYRLFSDIPYIILFAAAISMFPLTLSTMFNQKPHLIHKLLIWLSLIFALINFILSGPNPNPFVVIVFPSLIIIYSTRVLLQAWRNKQKGVWFVAGGFLGLIVSTVASVFYAKYSQDFKTEIYSILGYLMYGSVPLGLTAFMASRFRDLYRNLEQKVKERTRDLNQSLEELKSTQSQLIQSEKMASLGQLTAGIAHEIQNPLNFVNNFSEISNELVDEMKEELSEGSRQLAAGSRQSGEEKLKLAEEIANDIKQNLEKINHHGKRAESIVKGMLLHSRGNSGHKELIDINALCDEYLRLSYHGFRAKDKSFYAEYKLEADKSLPKIEVVPQDIGRVLLNLINNAFYAVDEKKKAANLEGFENLQGLNYQPTVSVHTKKLVDKIEIVVKDNGNGIPKNVLDKIFQPFFTTKPTGQGTGLGLSLAYDIVKAHGGEITVESKPAHDGSGREGEGTEFIIEIPIKTN